MKAFITVIGKDKVGIIHSVTNILKQSNVNILDINQTLMQEYFTMIMHVDLEKMNTGFNELKKKLEYAGREIDVFVKIQHEDIFRSMHTI